MRVCFLIAALWLCSCNVAKKAHSYANSHPEDFAGFCAKEFPVKDTAIFVEGIKFDTLYKEGEPRIETTYLRDTVFKTVYFPGTTQFVTKTVTRDSLIIRRDVAAETAIRGENANLIVVNKDLVAQRDKYKDKFNWWRIACFILAGVIIIFLIGKFWGGGILKLIR